MKISSILSLGIRLSLGGGRQAIGRLLLAGASVSLAVGLLLSALGAFAAEGALDRRIDARAEIHLSEGEPIPGDHLLVEYSGVGRFRGRDIETRFVSAVGDHPPVPPWLSRWPGPGEMVVSPALAELLEAPEGALLRPRYAGRIVQTLDPEWLIERDELAAYIGVRPEEMPRVNRSVVTGFGPDPRYPSHAAETSFAESIQQPMFQAVFLVSIGLLVPIAVFIATATRLSAAAREARLAAIRLVGGTPRQVRLAASVESLLAGLIGGVFGILLFFAGRPIVAAFAPPDHHWFPSDIAPSVGTTALVLTAIVIFAVAVSVATLRRVVITPLGVVRRTGRPVRVRWRLATLATGLGGSVVLMIGQERILGGPVLIAYVFVFGSFGLTSIGAAAVAPLVGTWLADLLRRVSPGTGVLLGARRLRADPRGAGRIVAGLVVVVFGVGLTHGFTSAFAVANEETPVSLRSSTVSVSSYGPGSRDMATKVATVPGVSSVVPVWSAEISGGGFADSGLVADCEALQPLLVEELPSCAEGTMHVDRFSTYYSPDIRLNVIVYERGIDVSFTPSRVIRSSVGFGAGESVFVPLASLPDGTFDGVKPSYVLARTSGGATVERIRNRFAGPGSYTEAVTGGEIRRSVSFRTSEFPQVARGVELGTIVALAVVAASMLVAAVDSIGERRRSFAMLAAAGTPISVMRKAVVTEIAMPLLGGVAIAVVTSVAVTKMFFAAASSQSFDGRPVPIPVSPFVRVCLFTVAAASLAALSTFPSLSRAIRPEALRAE
jgi:hypothetical protein